LPVITVAAAKEVPPSATKRARKATALRRRQRTT
jgi:hypothetical protein